MLIPPAGEQLSGMDPRVSVRVEQLTPKPIRTRFLGTHVYKILEMEIPRSRTRVSGPLLSIPALKGPYLIRCVRLYLRKCFFFSMGVCSIVIGMERKVHVEWIQKEYISMIGLLAFIALTHSQVSWLKDTLHIILLIPVSHSEFKRSK